MKEIRVLLRPFRLLLIFLLLMPTSSILSQRLYRFYNDGDWVSYTNFRYITTIARGFNTIYFGTSGGILRYDMRVDKWLDPITTSDGMPDNRVRRLAVDHMTDELWIETPISTSYFNETFNEWRDNEPFPMEKVQQPGVTLAELPQFIVDPAYNYFPQGLLIDRRLMQYPITQLLRDDADVVWMGIWGLGAAKADLRRVDLQLLPFGLYDADVACLDRDGNNFWFLGGGAGLPGTITHFDRNTVEWKYFEPLRESRIISDQFYAINHDDKYIWLGTELGLVRLDKKTNEFRSYSHFDGIYGERVSAILPTKGYLLIGTELGVSVLDVARDSIHAANSDNIKGRVVYDFAMRDRTIYAATEYGVFSLEWGGSQWKKLKPTSPVLQGDVFDIQIVDSLLYSVGDDGVVVVNLNNNDATLYDRNTTFHNALFNKVLIHKGVIWVGSSDGVYRLNARTGNWYHYTTNDGLIGSRISSLVADGDYVWIGTDKGATRFLWKSFNRSDWLQ